MAWCRSRCSWLFLASFAIICFGVCVVGTALGTLAFTSSFVRVFPFGAPLWTGALFLILGCYMFIAYRPSEFHLPASSHTQIWFTLVMSIVGVLECLLAISLFVWYRVDVTPALRSCYPDLTSLQPSGSASPTVSQQPVTCECVSRFIDPPSLRTTVHHFVGVSDCSSLGGVLGAFHWALLALYASGIALAIFAGVLAARRLHSSGACCGKSGAYAVTPEPTTPTSMTTGGGGHMSSVPVAPSVMSSPTHAHLRALSVAASSGSTLPGFGITQRVPGRSSPAALSTLHTHYSASTLRSQASRVPRPSTSSSHTAV